MRVPKLNRRHFLIGAGGFTLALPYLPSLLSRAEAGVGRPPKRFIAMATQHGGVWPDNMYPSQSTLTGSQEVFPGHTMRYGALASRLEGGDAVLSPVLRAPADRLTDSVVSKMNVLRGLDVTFYIAHHTGGYLGNFARNDGNAGPDAPDLDWIPTIDQVMAWSPSFYSAADLTTTIRERSMHVGLDGDRAMSWGWSEPGGGGGTIVPMASSTGSLDLFDRIFVPDESTVEPRPLVVDRVLESYNRLRSGAFGDANRLSAADKQRLDDHMDRLHELQRRLSANAATCGDLTRPTDNVGQWDDGFGGYTRDLAAMRRAYQLYNDVIVAAFICGTSRIATIFSEEMWADVVEGADWHEQIAHQGAQPDGYAQGVIAGAQGEFFRSVFVDLAAKLDVEEADGLTYLDNSLMMWTQESGILTHESDSMPLVLAGGAGGALATGQYLDYRDETNMGLVASWEENAIGLLRRPGLSYTQWLANALMAMDVMPSEFELGHPGYGADFNDRNEAYPSRVHAAASTRLPRLWRA
jgi:hypothetical protein